jgi:uncharacterized protein (TIGR02246 family)
MNRRTTLTSLSLIFFLCVAPLCSEETHADPLAGLQQAAADFVSAFNAKDPAALASLFMESGEICGRDGGSLISGREQIVGYYTDYFAGGDAPSLALEVASVRLIGPGLAIEDGVAHFTPPGKGSSPRSAAYTAVLMKSGDSAWRIASSRTLDDVTDDAGHLEDLADVIKGDWTAMSEGLRLDLAFGWDVSGNFLSGEMLTTAADGEPQTGTIRISWDAARKAIVSWIFDDRGGVSEGVWTPTETGWIIHTDGTTGEGERLTASQALSSEGENTLIWVATHRVVNGTALPDNFLRLVRQAPEPNAE